MSDWLIVALTVLIVIALGAMDHWAFGYDRQRARHYEGYRRRLLARQFRRTTEDGL